MEVTGLGEGVNTLMLKNNERRLCTVEKISGAEEL